MGVGGWEQPEAKEQTEPKTVWKEESKDRKEVQTVALALEQLRARRGHIVIGARPWHHTSPSSCSPGPHPPRASLVTAGVMSAQSDSQGSLPGASGEIPRGVEDVYPKRTGQVSSQYWSG